MKGTIKKIVSVLLALAMVVTSLNYTPKTVDAAVEWNALANFSLQKDGATDLAYRVVVGSETNSVYVYGSYYMHVYPNKSGEPTAIYFDEGLTTEGSTVFDGWNNQLTGSNIQFGFGLNSERQTGVFNKDKYYSLRIVYPDGDVVFQFKVGSPADIEEPSETPTETTTAETPVENLAELAADASYNLALKKTVTATAIGEGKVGNITDGQFNTYGAVTDGKAAWGVPGGAASLTVDLGNYYQADTIDEIIVRYKDNNANDTVLNKSYSIQYSVHGTIYRDVVAEKTVESLDGTNPQTRDDVSKVSGNVRYIRVNYPTTPDFGMQVSEIIVLDSDKNQQTVEPIILDNPQFTAAADGYNKIKVTIDEVEGQSDYDYYIILDNEIAKKATPGTHILENIDAGTHTVDVIAYRNGSTSDQTTSTAISVDVTASYTYSAGTKETAFDAQKEINGKVNYDYTDYKGVTASVSSNEGTAGNAFNNNVGDGWQAADDDKDNQWITINLGALRKINQIEAIWENASAKDYTVEVSTDGTNYEQVANIKNAASGNNRWDTINFMEPVYAQYVKVHGVTRTLDNYGMQIREIAIYGPNTADEEVIVPINPIEEPVGATWTNIGKNANNEYYIYLPTGDLAAYIPTRNVYSDNVLLGFGILGAPFRSVQLNGVDIEKSISSANVKIKEAYLNGNGVYKLDIVAANGSDKLTAYIKKAKVNNYKPDGVLATADVEAKTATVTWTRSEDAIDAGCTYTVQVADLEPVTGIVGTTATINLETLEYANYEVTVNAVLNGEVVGTAKGRLQYKDPEAIDSVLTVEKKWESSRSQKLSWTKAATATGYAVYVDGKLYETVGADVLNYNVPAYAYANQTNKNGQKTTVGNHSVAVVALLEGDTVEENLASVSTHRVIGKKTFNISVNYVYGNGTNLWNDTGVDSPWNFTICESVADKITEAADVKVTYDTDGAAKLTINDNGTHGSGDQDWTIKAAIYDGYIGTGNFINLAFDIKAPACLIGQTITIKCCPEEIMTETEDTVVYSDDLYEELPYTFEEATDANGETYAVLHYSNSFEARQDTYDLLFGLGFLDPETMNDGQPLDITFSDTSITKVYGLTSLTPSPVVNKQDIDNSSIFVSWETDVPSHLKNEYSYKVYIDDELAKLPEGESVYKDNLTFAGYAPGTHKVRVESIYNGAITSTKEAKVTIEDMDKPDLVVTAITIPEGEHHIGDTIPVEVTVKNIGTAKVVGDDVNHLTIQAYVAKKDLGYRWVNDGKPTIHTLDAGESYTATFEYTIADAEDKGGYLYDFSATVDSDKKFTTVESNPDNNTFKKTFKFFAKITPVTLTNEGDHIKADWNDHDSTNEKFILTYTVDGETEPRTIETTGNISEIDLPKGVWLAAGSEVKVTAVHTDGSSHHFAESVALPDLVISKVDIPRNAYAVGEKVPIQVTMKNVGVATAIPNPNANMTLKPTKNGSLLTANVDALYRTMADDNLEQKLTVGQEFTYTFNYTVQQEDLTADTIQLGGHADGDYVVKESIDNSDTDNGNNVSELSIKIMEKGTLTLDSNNGEGPVTATWSAANEERVKGYKLKYTTDGKTYKEVAIDDKNVVYDADAKTYKYTFPAEEGIFNQTDVTVMVTFDENTESGAYYDFASDKAQVDLTITKVELVREDNSVLTEAFTVNTFEKFHVRTYIKNIGTACVKPCTSDVGTTQEAEGINITARDANNNVLKGNGVTAKVIYTKGLTVGQDATVDVGVIQLEKQGVQNINVNVDDVAWNFDDAEGGIGYIKESDETNNRKDLEMDVHLVQEPMDWTPLRDSTDASKIYEFEVANSSLKRSIEYKVLATSYTDINYKDLVTKAVGYNAFYMSIGFEGNHNIVNVNHEKGKMDWSYTNTWFQQVKKSYLVDQNGNATGNVELVNNEYLSNLPSQGCDIYDKNGTLLENTAQTPLGYVGNGFNFNVNSFAPGKYYMMSIVDYDDAGNQRDYITLAFRVTTELEGWARVGASDATDIDKLAAFYHDSSYQLDGRFYYDCSDLGLACIKAYNGTHITLTTDTSKKLNDDIEKTKVEIAYGVYDAATNSVVAPENWKQVCVNPGIYGKEGTNNLQIQIANLTKQLPIHSAKGGETDYEYYFMKVYYDTENKPDDFIPVPFMVATEIPKIIPVQGLSVGQRGNTLGIRWSSTAAQVSNGYLYDVYVNGTLLEKDVKAGTYFYTDENVDTVGTQYEVKVVAKWCYDGNSTASDPIHQGEYQQAESVVQYTVQAKEEEPEETIPADKPDYPRDDKWVLIDGQCVLPVTNNKSASGQTVDAQIWYYTDVDMYNVVGYNDYYLSLNGNKDYFTGQDVMLYVQNGDGEVLASKKIYDKYYPGQVLMNAADMFTTYGEWNNGDELYYTVRIAGDGGNTYKDFYFKVIPNEYTDDQKINAKGDWRHISGDYTLPVSFSDLELEGTISFLDCPVTANNYTGTNTYDMIGYNDDYIAMNGSGTYYTGKTTKLEISEPSASVLYAENAESLTFTDKPIYDKVYSGQIQINAEEVFTVAYDTTYYLLKITGSNAEGVENVTYVPVKIEVAAGDVEVQGYQMNTDASKGAVSEFNPSFRVVSKTSKVMLVKGELKKVTGYGTVYALNDDVKDNYSNMKLGGNNIYNVDATNQGILTGWTSSNGDHQYNTYYAVTLKHLYYSFSALTMDYAFRAYAKLEDGTVVYGNNVYSVSIEEIAENLYQNQKMKSAQAHEFLYNNVLNKIAINNNRLDICKAMLNALKVPNTSDPNYKIINGTIKSDLYNYVYCKGDYKYSERNGEGFVSLGLDEATQTKLLSDLNAVRNTKYTTLADWMYNEIENYKNTKTGITYKGFYRKVAYDFDSGIDKKFDSE